MPKFLPSTAHRSTCMCIFLLAVFPHKRATIKAAADMNDHCCIGRHIDGETHNIAQQLCSLQITNQSRHCRSRLMVTNGRGVTVWISNEVCQKHQLQTARHSYSSRVCSRVWCKQSCFYSTACLRRAIQQGRAKPNPNARLHLASPHNRITTTKPCRPERTLGSGFATLIGQSMSCPRIAFYHVVRACDFILEQSSYLTLQNYVLPSLALKGPWLYHLLLNAYTVCASQS